METSCDDALDFFLACGILKTTKRTGWVESGVHLPESVSDHMHRMALISLIIRSHHIDFNRCVQMSIVHDLAEAIVGDLTPDCGISKSVKHQMEREALGQMLAGLAGPVRDHIAQLWAEYEAMETAESRLVKDIDKFEMLIQAFEYERDQGLDLDRFYWTTLGRIQTDVVKALAASLMTRRRTRLQVGGSDAQMPE